MASYVSQGEILLVICVSTPGRLYQRTSGPLSNPETSQLEASLPYCPKAQPTSSTLKQKKSKMSASMCFQFNATVFFSSAADGWFSFPRERARSKKLRGHRNDVTESRMTSRAPEMTNDGNKKVFSPTTFQGPSDDL